MPSKRKSSSIFQCSTSATESSKAAKVVPLVVPKVNLEIKARQEVAVSLGNPAKSNKLWHLQEVARLRWASQSRSTSSRSS